MLLMITGVGTAVFIYAGGYLAGHPQQNRLYISLVLFMIAMMTRFFGRNRSWKEGFEVAPFAILTGLAFTVPYALTGVFLGPEFPSIIGSLVGLVIVVSAAKAQSCNSPPESSCARRFARC